jgi:hypothetical protein
MIQFLLLAAVITLVSISFVAFVLELIQWIKSQKPQGDISPVEPPIKLELPKVPVLPQTPSISQNKPLQTVSATRLETFCTAIRDFEGQPGSLNYKNNNPGNVRCSPVGYLPKYGKVRCVNNFAVFETFDLGWEYLKNMVTSQVKRNPERTFLEYFTNYAPSSDGNFPQNYAKFVANRCGVTVNNKVSEYLKLV